MAETIGTAYVQIEPSAKGISGKISQLLDGEASSAGANAGSKLSSAMSSAAKIGIEAVAAATTAMVGFGAAAVNVGKDFDASMSQVAATMGMSIEEMHDPTTQAAQDFEKLREAAQEFGRTTSFSAQQSASALNFMALAGYDVETSISMLPNVLSLAAAGGIDLARASDMITDTQTAFGISLDRTTQLVDEMAKAASTGNTSVEQLGDAFLVVGGLAQELNGGMVTLADGSTQTVDGVQELEIALTAMANAGIKGSEAGTHMRNMLLKLSSPTDDGAVALKEMGVAVFDTEGKMRSLSDVFGDLSEAMSTMTQEQKISTISDLFNTRDIASAEALLNAVSQDWDKIGESILDAEGAAETMAEVQLDNLAGSITYFKSALEGAQIAISDQLSPMLNDFVKLGTQGLSDMTAAFKEDGLSGAMESFGNTLSQLVDKVVAMSPEMIEAGIQLLSALGQGLMDNLPMILDAAIDIIGQLTNAFLDALPQIVEAGIQILIKLGEGIVQALPELIPRVFEVIEQITKVITDNLDEILEIAGEIIITLAKGLAENLPEMVPQIIDIILNIVDNLIDNLDLLIDAAIEIIVALAEGLIDSLPRLAERLPEIIVKIIKTLTENAPKLIEASIEIIVQLVKGILTSLPILIESVPEIIVAIVDGLMAEGEALIQAGMDIVDGIWEGIKDSWEDLKNSVKDLAGDLVDAVKGFFEIGSPSKLFADEVGQWIPAGVSVGIDSNLDSLDKSMKNMEAELNPNDLSYSNDYVMSYQTETGPDNTEILDLLHRYLPNIATSSDFGNMSISVNKREFGRLVKEV